MPLPTDASVLTYRCRCAYTPMPACLHTDATVHIHTYATLPTQVTDAAVHTRVTDISVSTRVTDTSVHTCILMPLCLHTDVTAYIQMPLCIHTDAAVPDYDPVDVIQPPEIYPQPGVSPDVLYTGGRVPVCRLMYVGYVVGSSQDCQLL